MSINYFRIFLNACDDEAVRYLRTLDAIPLPDRSLLLQTMESMGPLRANILQTATRVEILDMNRNEFFSTSLALAGYAFENPDVIESGTQS
jgi:hypothetical protein